MESCLTAILLSYSYSAFLAMLQIFRLNAQVIFELCILWYTVNSTEYTEWQRPLSGVHSIMMEKNFQAGGGGARPPPFTVSTITYKVGMYAPAERADTLPPVSTLPLYVLCGKS